MNILLIGSGGREHALAWALRKSPLLGQLYVAPGNGGIAELAECVALDALDFAAVTAFVRAQDIGFVIVGPEAPLVAGLVDHLTAQGILAFGPTAAAARLEGSKGFTKDLCAANNIPTAAYRRFSDAAAAKTYIRQQGAPTRYASEAWRVVIKADGLAAGKGVVIAETLAEAEAAIDDILGGAFGAAGAQLVVEEFLYGEEASFFVLVDGATALPLATAQDHKRVGEGDTGPNTGGMGAYSPAPVMSDEICAQTMRRIIEPTIAAMAAAGTPFRGVLFAGLMITDKGPYLIEYNARFGDPECQVLMARLESDLLPALLASAEGALAGVKLNWSVQSAVTVVMAAKGYPGDYKKGEEIAGLSLAGQTPGVRVFHAGTARQNGQLVSNGGRVLNVTATGDTISQAVSRAYSAVDKIIWPGGFCRHDIAWRALERERQSG